ncbi:hypothetical protein [Streptomyces sp. NPDC008240]|uniref:hypothetical protein n=1 Tax=Streptomyces sp. NPDC008240 TaxID=3364822 RepID=UPI0036F11F92
MTLARHNQTLRDLAGESKRRQEAEQQLAEKDAAILRMQSLVSHHRDEHPDTPIQHPQPVQGDAELRRQLALARRALRDLTARLDEAQAANVALTAELHDLRLGVAS